MDKAYLVREVKSFLMDEDGVGVIELVLILVVLIGLVIVFKKQINTLLTNIFKQINRQFISDKPCRRYAADQTVECESDEKWTFAGGSQFS